LETLIQICHKNANLVAIGQKFRAHYVQT